MSGEPTRPSVAKLLSHSSPEKSRYRGLPLLATYLCCKRADVRTIEKLKVKRASVSFVMTSVSVRLFLLA